MDSIKLKLVFDRKKVSDTNKVGMIEVYIYDSITQKKVYISTGIEVTKDQFKQDKGERGCIVKHINKVSRNAQLDRIYREIEAFALSDKCVTLDDVRNWDKEDVCEFSVISFIESELKRNDPSLNVIKRTQVLINQLERFGHFKTFKDFTYSNIVDFDTWLKNNGVNEVTAHKKHSRIRGYIREAINRGYCSYDPYLTFKPKKGKSKDPIYLEEREIIAIQKCKLDNERLVKVRDLFVFQCFTGLSYIDLSRFKKEDITEIDGYKVIKSNRQKTDQSFITVLLPESMEILERYNYDLPIISSQKYNEYLKALTLYVIDDDKKQIITKHLTSHVARHTFGTYLINKSVPIEVVAKAMGHSNTKMTQHYARLLGKTVVSGIVDNVFKKKD